MMAEKSQRKRTMRPPMIHLSDTGDSVLNVHASQLLTQGEEDYVVVVKRGDKLLLIPFHLPKGKEDRVMGVMMVGKYAKACVKNKRLALQHAVRKLGIKKGRYPVSWDDVEVALVVEIGGQQIGVQ